MDLDEMFPDDLLSGSPRKRYFDLFAVADQFVIENEMLALFAKLAKLEQFVEAKELDSELASFVADQEKIDKQIDNLIIESMAKIVSSHER